MTVAQQLYLYLAVAIAVVVFLTKADGNLPGTAKPDRITYVFDITQDPISAYVRQALRDVGRTGIMAESMDIHPDVIQDRDKPALNAAKAASKLPVLVVQAGDKVLQVIEHPTPEQIRGFAQ